MTMPKTLMEMAGARPQPQPLAQSVIVMIDCQREYLDGAVRLAGVEAALAEGGRLLELGRRNGVPIVHVRHRGRAGGLFDAGGGAFAICDAVAPRNGETIVDKTLPNAFAGTSLDEAIKATGRKTLIVAGFMTHMCVSSTVRSALDHGYGCTVVDAACATRDLPDGRGGVVSAADLHRACLAALADRFAVVVRDSRALPQD